MAAAWLILALVLVAAEIHSVAFFAVFGSVGALAAAAVALARPEAIAVQAVVAFVVGALSLLLIRPYVSRAFARPHGSPAAVGVHGGFVGEKVVVIDAVSPQPGGHVRLAGEVWLARTGSDIVLPAGSVAMIVGVFGTTLTVEPSTYSAPVDQLPNNEGTTP